MLGLARRQNDTLQAQATAAGAALIQWPVDLAEPLAPAERLAAWLAGFDGTTITSATLINNAGLLSTPAALTLVPLLESLRVHSPPLAAIFV